MTRMSHPAGYLGVVLLTIALGGCGKTLVFGERSGVNIALRVNADRPPPVEVNIGLERQVGAIVPPTRVSRNNDPSGDAVSMFSGFQVESFDDPISIKPATAPKTAAGPFNVDVLIGTQFASGAAAVEIAKGDPDVVKQIVTVGDIPKLAGFSTDLFGAVSKARDGIRALGLEGRRCLAKDLNMKLPARNDPQADVTINRGLTDTLRQRANDTDLPPFQGLIDAAKTKMDKGVTC